MSIFGRRKADKAPVGAEGQGPSYGAPELSEGSPYVNETYLPYAPPAYNTEQIWNTNNHYDSPPPGDPESWGKYNNSQTQQYPLEQSDGREEVNVTWRKNRAPDPRWVPVEPSRTPRVPAPYRFQRQYSDYPKYGHHELAGTHFSMADHRREYPVGGMRGSTRVGRNTYRLTPADWDETSGDQVPSYSPPPMATQTPDPLPNTLNRSYRLT